MRTIVSLFIGMVGVAGATALLWLHRVSEPSFIILVCVSLISAFVVAFIDKISSFSLRDMTVELARVESARKEVEQKEKDVRQVAIAIAEITVFLAAFHRRMGSEETHLLEAQWLNHRAEMLLGDLSIGDAEKRRIMRYLLQVDEMDSLKKTDRDGSLAKWNHIWAGIRDEVKGA